MGVTKQYLRYKPCGTCNLIGSTWARLTVLNSSSRGGQICAVGACEDVLLWNLKKAEKVCCITTKITYRMRPSQGLARHLELIGLTSKKQTRLVTTIVVVCSWNRLLWQQKLYRCPICSTSWSPAHWRSDFSSQFWPFSFLISKYVHVLCQICRTQRNYQLIQMKTCVWF